MPIRESYPCQFDERGSLDTRMTIAVELTGAQIPELNGRRIGLEVRQGASGRDVQSLLAQLRNLVESIAVVS